MEREKGRERIGEGEEMENGRVVKGRTVEGGEGEGEGKGRGKREGEEGRGKRERIAGRGG